VKQKKIALCVLAKVKKISLAIASKINSFLSLVKIEKFVRAGTRELRLTYTLYGSCIK